MAQRGLTARDELSIDTRQGAFGVGLCGVLSSLHGLRFEAGYWGGPLFTCFTRHAQVESRSERGYFRKSSSLPSCCENAMSSASNIKPRTDKSQREPSVSPI